MRLSPVRSAVLVTLGLAGVATAQTARPANPNLALGELQKDYFFEELGDGSILAADTLGNYAFRDFGEYVQSSFFVEHGLRCGSDRLPQFYALGTAADCSGSNTTIK